MKSSISTILSRIPDSVCVIAVSKMHTKAEIDDAYQQGCRIFGENKVQELKQKYDASYHWHMIGHLQRNKVKDVVALVDMIQSVDSLRLAAEIEKQCAKINKVMPILIEVNISQETNKSGIAPEECGALIEQCMLFPHIDVQGLMCVGPLSEDQNRIASCFQAMQGLFSQMKAQFGEDRMRFLSMGMSDDYQLAIKSGSNMVRLGSCLFGERDYTKKDGV